MMSAFRLATFDVTNTLLRLRLAVGTVYSDAASTFAEGLNLNHDLVDSNFRKTFKELLTEHPNFGAHSGLTSKRWWAILTHRTFTQSAPGSFSELQLTRISEYLYHLYETDTCWEVLPGCPELLAKIQSKGIKLGVISNFDSRLNAVLNSNKLLPYFNFILCSSVVGVAKPDRRIFDLAKTKAGGNIVNSECLHVGDDEVNDYYGAKSAGWRAALFEKSGVVDKSRLDVVQTAADIDRIIFSGTLDRP